MQVVAQAPMVGTFKGQGGAEAPRIKDIINQR